MFKKLKDAIRELAKKAVVMAEEALGSKTGKQKKAMALEFIISNIPVIAPFKTIIAGLLSKFIDDAIVRVFKGGGNMGNKPCSVLADNVHRSFNSPLLDVM